MWTQEATRPHSVEDCIHIAEFPCCSHYAKRLARLKQDPIFKVLIRPGRDSNRTELRPARHEASALTTRPRFRKNVISTRKSYKRCGYHFDILMRWLLVCKPNTRANDMFSYELMIVVTICLVITKLMFRLNLCLTKLMFMFSHKQTICLNLCLVISKRYV